MKVNGFKFVGRNASADLFIPIYATDGIRRLLRVPLTLKASALAAFSQWSTAVSGLDQPLLKTFKYILSPLSGMLVTLLPSPFHIGRIFKFLERVEGTLAHSHILIFNIGHMVIIQLFHFDWVLRHYFLTFLILKMFGLFNFFFLHRIFIGLSKIEILKIGVFLFLFFFNNNFNWYDLFLVTLHPRIFIKWVSIHLGSCLIDINNCQLRTKWTLCSGWGFILDHYYYI